MPDIARRAGVGVGTIYRQFPTKEALIGALARAHFAGLADIAERRAGEEGDPWESFAGLLWEAAGRFGTDLGLAQVMADMADPRTVAGPEIARLRAATQTLMTRAQEAGALRADATIDDIPTIMCALGKIVAMEGAGHSDWRRFLTISLDGLRSAAAAAGAAAPS